MKSTETIISSFCTSTEKAVEASFLVKLRIVKYGKPHFIGRKRYGKIWILENG